jgi:hypothetical protein
MANFKIVGDDGDACPRCGQPTQIREHKSIRPKELRRPFYYSRWFYCDNPKCKTNTVVPESSGSIPPLSPPARRIVGSRRSSNNSARLSMTRLARQIGTPSGRQ